MAKGGDTEGGAETIESSVHGTDEIADRSWDADAAPCGEGERRPPCAGITDALSDTSVGGQLALLAVVEGRQPGARVPVTNGDVHEEPVVPGVDGDVARAGDVALDWGTCRVAVNLCPDGGGAEDAAKGTSEGVADGVVARHVRVATPWLV